MPEGGHWVVRVPEGFYKMERLGRGGVRGSTEKVGRECTKECVKRDGKRGA